MSRGRQTIAGLAQALEAGKTSARELVEQSIAAIRDNAKSGGPVFLEVDEEAARLTADFIDGLRQQNRAPSRFAGIPFSAKDLFDQAGQVTTAGSVVLRDAAPAEGDADAIARLKLAGMIVLGRTNMTEFAYSGVGLNPHYGTPKSIYDRQTGRIPGGSSSGAAVSVADGSCVLALGTDTGGSCRVPAAFNGIVGVKCSLGRVSTKGVFPLATSFDTVGPLANSVACCATADALMTGDWDGEIRRRRANGLRLGVPQHLVLDDLDETVGAAFERAVSFLARKGAQIVDVPFKALGELPAINAGGGIGAVEAFNVHRDHLARSGDKFDQRVRKRILAGEKIIAADFLALEKKRQAMITQADAMMDGLDAFIMPTCPHIPAPIADLGRDEDYGRINLLALRNTFVGNFLNRCAMSLPINVPGAAPVGLMVMAPFGHDRQMFEIADCLEAVFSTH